MEYLYANDLFFQLLAKSRDAKATAEENSLQIVKIVMIYFFTALTIEGHNRVPSLTDYAFNEVRCFQNGSD
jgi:hypothetical protein